MHNYEAYIKKFITEMVVDENRRDTVRYCGELRAINRAVGTLIENVIVIKKIDDFLKKPFRDATKDDIIAFIDELRSGRTRKPYLDKNGRFKIPKIQPLKEGSLLMYQVRLKRFYQWLYGMEDKQYPENVIWIKLRRMSNHRKLPEDILTKEEIKKMYELANDTRDRALVHVLYESGCRIGELLGMRIKDVRFDQYGAAINVDGKTGERRLRLITSAPDLQNWIEHHPSKDEPKSPVWVTITEYCPDYYGKAITKEGVGALLKRLAQRAGIKKRVHPHLLRHSRATHMAKEYTESELKLIFGWSGGSLMPQTYIHLSGSDIENKILEKNGILQIENKNEKDLLKPLTCSRCNTTNPSAFKFCGKCSMPLTMKTAIEIEERRAKADNRMNRIVEKMMKEPMLKGWLRNTLKEIEKDEDLGGN